MMNFSKTLHLCVSAFIFFISFNAFAQYKIEVLDSNTFHLGEGVILSKTSFRGLSVVDDKIIWLSGSKGTIAKSMDGGKSFSFQRLKGYEKSDFRDIEAFDDKRAIIMSSGTPAYILKTIDGGQTWKEVYKNTDSAYFLDAMDFWNDKKGMLVGDPINGHFLLFQTTDGGETWQQIDTTKTPKAFPGEAVFAASGTSLRCWGRSDFGFVSGGIISRFFIAKNKGKKWQNFKIPILQGTNRRGCFSFSKYNKGFFFVGGDYLLDSTDENVFCYTTDEGKHFMFYDWLNNYQSCIEPINNTVYNMPVLVTTGTNSTYFAYYGCSFIGCGWADKKKFNLGFNVVRKAKKGKAVFLAGDKGKIGRLIY
jgi:Photosynthesis system II assembly factor YCF48